MKRYIVGFAETRSQLKSDLRAATKQVLNHLVKVFLYPKVQEQAHWKTEIATCLNDLPKMKSSNKYPKAGFLFDNTWKVFKETTDNRVKNIIDTMTEKPIETSYQSIYNAMEAYFKWICDELSKEGIVKNDDIYEKIEELRQKHFPSSTSTDE